jgi:ADP-heptose:LPS heptosyltransferase
MLPAAVVTFKQLGDTLLLQPALEHLSRETGAPTALFAKPVFAPLVERMPGACLPDPRARYGALWVFEHGSKAARRAFRLRARDKRLVLLREKYRAWYHPLVFRSIRCGDPKLYEYRAKFLYRAVGGDELSFRPPALRSPDLAWRPMTGLPENYVLVCPTAAWETKRWTVERWAQTLDALAARCDLPLVVVGGHSSWEIQHASDIVAATGAPVSNFVGTTSLKELLFIVSRASLAVCIDGAVAHLAAAFGVPGVTLFGPTRHEEWHWPGNTSVALSAREYSTEKSPSLGMLPYEPVVETALRLLPQ